MVVRRLIQLVGWAFLFIFYKCTLKLMYIIRRKSLNCVPSMLGFKQCILGCFYESVVIFWTFWFLSEF